MEFAAASGQNVLLVGPRGAGKTALIDTIINAQGIKMMKQFIMLKMDLKHTIWEQSCNLGIKNVLVMIYRETVFKFQHAKEKVSAA